MSRVIPGFHHVTMIAGNAQKNMEFYVGLLGQRLVKQTVNFDDPGTYHFYYGDETGSPGSILTFFPIAGAPRGRKGTGQTTAVALTIPESSLSYWLDRLAAAGVHVRGLSTRFGERVAAFEDPDGLTLELVAVPGAEAAAGWAGGTVPAEHGIRGVHSVTMSVADQGPSAELLTGKMGFHPTGREGIRTRYATGDGGPGSLVDLLEQPGVPRGHVAVGSVHHIAWRTADDAEQEAWRSDLAEAGFHVTPMQDRQYFHSVYFREPGGVLFEIATDPPGFTFDESVGQLGSALRLPPWLEASRSRIEERLPRVTVPKNGGVSS